MWHYAFGFYRTFSVGVSAFLWVSLPKKRHFFGKKTYFALEYQCYIRFCVFITNIHNKWVCFCHFRWLFCFCGVDMLYPDAQNCDRTFVIVRTFPKKGWREEDTYFLPKFHTYFSKTSGKHLLFAKTKRTSKVKCKCIPHICRVEALRWRKNTPVDICQGFLRVWKTVCGVCENVFYGE